MQAGERAGVRGGERMGGEWGAGGGYNSNDKAETNRKVG